MFQRRKARNSAAKTSEPIPHPNSSVLSEKTFWFRFIKTSSRPCPGKGSRCGQFTLPIWLPNPIRSAPGYQKASDHLACGAYQ